MSFYRSHLLHYSVLLLILLGGLFGFWRFLDNHFLRFWVLFLTLVGYSGWGVIHHSGEGRLSLKIVAEYLLLSLALLAAFSLTLRF